jgi:hypothetical protein
MIALEIGAIILVVFMIGTVLLVGFFRGAGRIPDIADDECNLCEPEPCRKKEGGRGDNYAK